jgi:DNA-binding transcriptional LysR family regulator
VPDIEPVLPGLDPIPVPIWLVTHRELHTSRRIRLVFDFLAEAFSDAQAIRVSQGLAEA